MTKPEAEKEVKIGEFEVRPETALRATGPIVRTGTVQAGAFKITFASAPEILPRFVEIKQIEDAIGGVVNQQYASVIDHSLQLTWQF